VQRGVHDVEALVARAEEGEDGFALRAARLVQAGQVEDARWILEHHADNVDALLGFTILGLLEEAPDLGEPLAAAVSGTLARTSDGETAGDLLYLLGSLEERPAFFAAGASALRGSFTGEPSLDRGHYTFLATLMSKGGDLDGALGFLASCSERWPDEPTFQLKSASLLLEERPGDSLAAADAAIAVAWGDNLLRASKARAQALVALGRAEEAAGYARSVLDDHPAPEEGLAVRTHRYRKALEELAESAP
jgi:tetratricopeptide (TPR) repeat protein